MFRFVRAVEAPYAYLHTIFASYEGPPVHFYVYKNP